jgi:hypothetical protein
VDRGRVGEDRGSKETDGCPLTVKRYLPSGDFDEKRDELKTKHDMVFENVALRKQHGLLYLELSHAMNYGDIGCIL